MNTYTFTRRDVGRWAEADGLDANLANVMVVLGAPLELIRRLRAGEGGATLEAVHYLQLETAPGLQWVLRDGALELLEVDGG